MATENKLIYHIDPSALLYYRKTKGLTQQELQKESGIKQANISNYENGLTKKVDEKTITALANALDCTTGDLQTSASRKLEVARGFYIRKQSDIIMGNTNDEYDELDVASASDVIKLFESTLEARPDEEEELSPEHEEALKSAAIAGSNYTEKFKGPGVPEE